MISSAFFLDRWFSGNTYSAFNWGIYITYSYIRIGPFWLRYVSVHHAFIGSDNDLSLPGIFVKQFLSFNRHFWKFLFDFDSNTIFSLKENIYLKISAMLLRFQSARNMSLTWEDDRIRQQGHRCNRIRPDNIINPEATDGELFGKVYDVSWSPDCILWPSGAIWRHISGSTLTALNHYLNQYWLIISELSKKLFSSSSSNWYHQLLKFPAANELSHVQAIVQ